MNLHALFVRSRSIRKDYRSFQDRRAVDESSSSLPLENLNLFSFPCAYENEVFDALEVFKGDPLRIKDPFKTDVQWMKALQVFRWKT